MSLNKRKGRSIIIENNKSLTEILLPDTVQRFVKVPKEVILANGLTEHRISTFLYLNYNQTWDNRIHYSPLYMIQWSGYKPNWHRGTKENIYTKFRDCMQWYFENDYIVTFDRTKYTQSIFQSSMLNEEKLKPKHDFGIVYNFEVEIINNHQLSYRPLNKSALLLLLSYVRAFTWVQVNKRKYSGNVKKSRPEMFYSQFKTIAAFIGLTPVIVSRATIILEELGLIKTYRMPSYKDANGQWHTDDVIYICPYKYISRKNKIVKCEKNEYDWHKELEHGINYLRERKFN